VSFGENFWRTACSAKKGKEEFSWIFLSWRRINRDSHHFIPM